jgi:hypothetical protein
MEARRIGREGGDKHPPLRARDLLGKAATHRRFGAGRFRIEHVGRVADQHVDASIPIWVNRSGLVGLPITGVGSSFQSPVWNTRPALVSITSALGSGIECDSSMKLTPNGPICAPATPLLPG